MSQTSSIPVANLLMDLENPRLAAGLQDQRDAIHAMLRSEGAKTIALAQDILNKGLNPADRLMVLPSPEEPKRYVVLEGNRRLTALRVLGEPEIAAEAVDAKELSKLKGWANQYAVEPIKEVDCVVFTSRSEAEPWIERRHTGEQRGVGVVGWGNLEKGRYAERKTGQRSPQLQVLDFVVQHGELDEDTREKLHEFKLTNLARVVSDKQARKRLGIDVVKGEVTTRYEGSEVAKGLTRLVRDIAQGLSVKKIYSAADRVKYLKGFKASELPTPENAGAAARPLLGEGTAVPATGAGSSGKTQRGGRRSEPRRTLASTTCKLKIANARIKTIFRELQGLKLDGQSNAAAVLFRVFVELTADHYVTTHTLLTGKDYEKATLAKKLTTVANHLESTNVMSDKELAGVRRASEDKRILGSTIVTFHAYVHNKDYSPVPSDLRVTWDNLQLFFERIWA